MGSPQRSKFDLCGPIETEISFDPVKYSAVPRLTMNKMSS